MVKNKKKEFFFTNFWGIHVFPYFLISPSHCFSDISPLKEFFSRGVFELSYSLPTYCLLTPLVLSLCPSHISFRKKAPKKLYKLKLPLPKN